jgi:hypothetical protein
MTLDAQLAADPLKQANDLTGAHLMSAMRGGGDGPGRAHHAAPAQSDELIPRSVAAAAGRHSCIPIARRDDECAAFAAHRRRFGIIAACAARPTPRDAGWVRPRTIGCVWHGRTIGSGDSKIKARAMPRRRQRKASGKRVFDAVPTDSRRAAQTRSRANFLPFDGTGPIRRHSCLTSQGRNGDGPSRVRAPRAHRRRRRLRRP